MQDHEEPTRTQGLHGIDNHRGAIALSDAIVFCQCFCPDAQPFWPKPLSLKLACFKHLQLARSVGFLLRNRKMHISNSLEVTALGRLPPIPDSFICLILLVSWPIL